MQKLFFAMMLTVVAGSVGCGGMGRTNWGCPGTAQVQRLRAEQFDPYPQIVSPSETPGTRPRDYDKPALAPIPPCNEWPWARSVVPR